MYTRVNDFKIASTRLIIQHFIAMESQEDFLQNIESSLNGDQYSVFKQCIKGDLSILCTGQGGTGKSWLLECIVKYFRQYRKDLNIAVTASTGIASFNIGGMTLHRFVGAGIEENDIKAMTERASAGASKAYWANTHILIIDEVSMVSATFFESISQVGSKIRNDERPFGGIRLLMFGDFLQLPPVAKSGDLGKRVFHTDAWKQINPRVMQLTAVVRQSNQFFRDVLAGIRYGICTELAEEFILSLQRPVEYQDQIEPVRLFAKRTSTDLFNEEKLSTLKGREILFSSTDTGNIGLLKQCPASKDLKLKLGSQVILTRNMDSSAVNGSIGTVTGFTNVSLGYKQPIVTFTDNNNTHFERTIGRVAWESVAPNGSILACRRQFPLLLSWAITIHRSQGATIPRLCIDMSGIFEVGQAYVALSRCPNPDNLQVLNFDKNYVMASRTCVEFYQEIAREQRDFVSESNEDLPGYRSVSEHSSSYEDAIATSVADQTQSEWDTTRVQHRREVLTEEPNRDVQLMMGTLSLRETSPHSHSNSEN